MNEQEAQEVISYLQGLDYTRQEDRNAAAQMLRALQGQPQLPDSVQQAIAEANAQLQEPGGVTAPDWQSRYAGRFLGFESPRQLLDELSVLIGAVNEMDTLAGQRYTSALVEAMVSGDPAAIRELDSIIAEDSGASEATRVRVGQAVTRALEAQQGITAEGVLAQGEEDRAAAAAQTGGEPIPMSDETEEGTPSAPGSGAPDLQFEQGISGAGGVVGYYGVPLMTMGEGGTEEEWAAIVNGERVAPRYAQGFSRQPARFGFTNEEQIARVQFQMEAAGLLEPGSYAPGVWDARTAGRSNTEGWRAVLAFSNMNGMEWEEGFARLYDAGTDASARGLQMDLQRLSRERFFADPADLRARTRRFLADLGRRPDQITDEEVDRLMNAAVFGAQQARQESLEAQIAARQGMMAGPEGTMIPGGEPTVATEDFEMNPVTYFDQELEKLMSREIESRAAQQATEAGGSRVARSASIIGSAG